MSNKPIIDSNNEIIKGTTKKHAWDRFCAKVPLFNIYIHCITWDERASINSMKQYKKTKVSFYKKVWDRTFKKAVDIEKHTIYDELGNSYLIDKDIGILAKLE